MFLKVLAFLAHSLERKFMPPHIYGWRTTQKELYFPEEPKKKKKERKVEVIFLILIYFCLFSGKKNFCLVACGQQLDCLLLRLPDF